jgi:hypothetical protein
MAKSNRPALKTPNIFEAACHIEILWPRRLTIDQGETDSPNPFSIDIALRLTG